jgi:hypothetical protein
MTTLMLREKTYTIQDDFSVVIHDLTEDKKIIGEIILSKEESQKLVKFLNDFYI